MEDRINQLNANPGDWPLRCSVILEYYDAGRYEEAAALIGTAPQIPNNEKNILFAATILGRHNISEGLGFLQRYTISNPTTPGIAQQKEAFQAALRQQAIAPVPAEHVPVPPAYEDLSSFDANSKLTEEQKRKPFVPAVEIAERIPDKPDKIRALIIAGVAHLVLIILLCFFGLTTPRPTPPQITATAPSETEESLDQRLLDRKKMKTAAAPPEVQLTVSVDAFSEISVPATMTAEASLSAIALSANPNSFAMSMGGFGSVSNVNSIPSGMQSRCSFTERMERLREAGGDESAEVAVKKGLEFLASQQNPDGSFGNEYYVGMTGLALLAYLGHCETPESVRYGDLVIGATMYLMERAMKNNGLLTNGKEGPHEAYEHAIGTYALCEFYSMTKESGREIPRLDSVINKAVGIIVNEQTKLGGWPYLGEEKDDMSVSGWKIQALKAAHTTGMTMIGVERALDLATKEYLPKIQDKDGAFKYHIDHILGRVSLTGAALLGLQSWKGKDSQAFDKGFRYLKRRTILPSPGDYYYAPYYNTQVFFIHGGEAWEEYNEKFQPKLLAAQNEDGSWLRNGSGAYAPEDSQITNTAWAILMLEVYYRYLPSTDKVRGAVQR
ncbi:MAG: prenyltransferase/squalene oxidase repeat-containing protein [Verrucomicrobiales bacterium]|nr:prenyltransferase/squalene oxidase repeat-containing protein [Verrucomicrobiales bacterium]